ncbi:hypothetical protein [Microlunatus ginsengisoli]|uniref:Uncharacterized protein n=1 Tax=Microlunatus ginsengisoli TaxID=363863 RepID=A0ABP6ZLN0_9ACTN
MAGRELYCRPLRKQGAGTAAAVPIGGDGEQTGERLLRAGHPPQPVHLARAAVEERPSFVELDETRRHGQAAADVEPTIIRTCA